MNEDELARCADPLLQDQGDAVLRVASANLDAQHHRVHAAKPSNFG